MVATQIIMTNHLKYLSSSADLQRSHAILASNNVLSLNMAKQQLTEEN